MGNQNKKKSEQNKILAEMLERVAIGLEKQEARADAQEKAEEKDLTATKGLASVNKKLIGGIAAWTTNIFSLRQVFGGLAQANTDLTRTLITTSQMGADGMQKFNRSFQDQGLNMSDSIAVFKEAAGLGMAQMSESTLGFLGGAKSLGLGVGALGQNIISNTQAMGLGEEQSVALADTLYSTSKTYGISSDKMVAAMNSMKSSLLKATVSFGPEAAKAMQVVSARMIGTLGQEFADASTKMISDYTTGSAGMMRSMMLGVDPMQMTQGGEGGMAAGMEQISRKIVELREQAGNDVSTPFILEAMEKQYGITTEQFNLAEKMLDEHGGSLDEAVNGMIQSDVNQRKQNDAMATLDETMRKLQMLILPVLQTMAGWIEKLGGMAPWVMGGGMIAAFVGPAMIKDKRDDARTNRIVDAIKNSAQTAQRAGGAMGGFMKNNIGAILGAGVMAAGIAKAASASKMEAAPMAANIRDRETYGKDYGSGGSLEMHNGVITKDISYDTGAFDAGTAGYDQEYEKLWEAQPDGMAAREQAMLEAQMESQRSLQTLTGVAMTLLPFMQQMGLFSKITATFSKLSWVQSVKRTALQVGHFAWKKVLDMKSFAIDVANLAWQPIHAMIAAVAGATWSGGATLAVVAGGIAAMAYVMHSDNEEADEKRDIQTAHLQDLVELGKEKQMRDETDNPLFTIARDMALNTAMMGELTQMTSEANEQRSEGNELTGTVVDQGQEALDGRDTQ